MYMIYGAECLTFSGYWIHVLLLLPELMLRLRLLRSCAIFWSAIFPTFNRGLRRMCLQFIRESYYFCSGFRRLSESKPYEDRREIVPKSYGLR